jgi:hypothetical protein
MSNWRREVRVVDPRPLREALERQVAQDAAYRELERVIEERLGPDWRTHPYHDLRRACEEKAVARGGDASGASALADWLEASALIKLLLERLEAVATSGLGHPLPREVWEREYAALVEERHGEMTPLALRVWQREFGFDPAGFE